MTDIKIKNAKDELRGIYGTGIVIISVWFFGRQVPRMIRKHRQDAKKMKTKEICAENPYEEA